MSDSTKRADDAIERLRKSGNDFTKILLDIVRPVNLNEFKKPLTETEPEPPKK